ncbi:hypothetical protein BK143_09490 [Paenibacillus peoriae]|uniref:hypothetical protein n=1 Tax=Paenibacillus peoriae TaxID=59893 RepID=UPI00096D70EA|nr:hypothetical protein [Paenibacillus peoriae]OMF72491.1 hypothetical protein BK143_09490 [Paenibacillus peoriae]
MFKRNKSSQKGNNNVNMQDFSVNVYEQKHDVIKLAAEGKFEEAADLLSVLLKGSVPTHPASPYWKYTPAIENETIVFKHTPTSKESFDKCPIKGKIFYDFPEKYKTYDSLNGVLKHSYEKQIPITLNIKMFETWIGDFLVEKRVSDSKRDLTIEFSPEKFPSPVPMKLYFTDGSFAIDYLEVGLIEIDDKVYIFDNSKEEGRKIDFRLEANLNGISKINLKINSLHRKDVQANYIMARYLLEASKDKSLALKLLKHDENLFVANKFSLDEPVPDSISDEIIFLSFLIQIEKRENFKFELPESIDSTELETYYNLMRMIDEGKIEGKYTDVTATIASKESLINLIKLDDKNPLGYKLTFEKSEPYIELFGKKVLLKSQSIAYEGLKISNKDRLKRLVVDMEEGETFNVKFQAGSNNVFIEIWEFY